MSLLDSVKDAVRSVIAQNALSEGFQYRQVTSAPATQPRTYGSWSATFYGLLTSRRTDEIYNDERQTTSRVEAGSFRMTDATALRPGDQIRDAATNTVWTLESRESGAAGVCKYRVIRELPNKQAPNRNGGL